MSYLMAGRQQVVRTPRATSFVLVALMLTAVYVALHSLSYRETIVIFVVLGAVAVILEGPRGIHWGFVLVICGLGIGYRTVSLTPVIRLHPVELMLWGLLALLLAVAALRKSARSVLRLPLWLWFFMPFCVWGWFVGLQAGYRWDLMLAELRNFLLLVPLFVVAGAVLRRPARWRSVLLTFYCTGTWIAAMGVLEYSFPGIHDIFPDFVSNPLPTQTAEGFERAGFSFWGEPSATFICVLAVPMALPLWRWWPARWQRAFTLFALSLQVWAIYIGGFRIVWLLVGVQALLFFTFARRYALAGLAIVVTLAGYGSLPTATQGRIHSLVLVLRGTPADSSGVKHLSRPRDALETAMEKPLGIGWSGAGWVHCDFLQIAANLGIAAGLLFFGAYIATLLKLLWGIHRGPRQGEQWCLRLAFLLSFTAAGGLLATQVIGVLPQLAVPVWLVWVLAEIHLRQYARMTGGLRFATRHLRPASNL